MRQLAAGQRTDMEARTRRQDTYKAWFVIPSNEITMQRTLRLRERPRVTAAVSSKRKLVVSAALSAQQCVPLGTGSSVVDFWSRTFDSLSQRSVECDRLD